MTHFNHLHIGILYILLNHEPNGSTYERLLMYLKNTTRDVLKNHLKDLMIIKYVETYQGSTTFREGRPNTIFEIKKGLKVELKTLTLDELSERIKKEFINYNL